MFVLLPTILVAQTRQVQTYSLAEGLAQSQVYAVWADAHGYIWAGTQGGGLSRFDGLSFTTFSTKEGLPDEVVNDIWAGEKGDLWVGTNNGIAVFDGQHFKTVLDKGIIALDGYKQDIWALSTDSLYHKKKDKTWEAVAFPKPYLITYDILIDKDRLLLGSDRGVWQWFKGKWTLLKVKFSGIQQIWSLYSYRNTQVWGLSAGGELFIVGADSLRRQSIPPCIPTVFYIAPSGDSWLGTQRSGLFVLPKGSRQWEHIQKKDGLGSNFIRAITGDIWGNIWVGNSGGGLSRLQQSPFRSYDQQRGLPGKEVYALLEDDSLGLLLSLNEQGIYQQNFNNPIVYNSDESIRSLKIKSFALDHKKRLWIGTEREGLKMQTDSNWLEVRSCGAYIQDVLPTKNVSASGQMWVATAYEGLSLLSMKEDSNGIEFHCKNYGTRDQLPTGRIENLAYDNSGRLLISYRNQGVACWLPGKLYWHSNRETGLPSNWIRAARQDAAAYYWLASSNGLIRLDWHGKEAQIDVFNHKDGLESDNFYSLVLDENNDVWAGSEKGVELIKLNEARLPIHIDFLGKDDGFTGIENCTNAALMDSKGNLWFGTMNGLMMKPNGDFELQQLPPPLLAIEDLRIFYESIKKDKKQNVLSNWGAIKRPLVLKYFQNHIGIRLSAHDLAKPSAIRYQWKLEGWDEQWSPPGTQQDITYANLPPGNYQFSAKAVGEGGRESKLVKFDIEIIPAFWQTQWFQGLLIGVLALFLILFIWLSVRKWKRKQKVVEERLRLDNKLLELEQKALQLQMNPHFLANALQGIQYELNHGDKEKASRYLDKFGNFMRTTLYHSRSSKISLADELGNLKHYLDIEKFRLGDRFTYHFDVPEDLEIDLIQISPMLLQPFLENAIYHGLQSKEKDGKLDIIIREKGLEYLLITIKDNGPGLGRNKHNNQRSNHRSVSLKVIQERLNLLSNQPGEETFSIKEIIENQEIKGVEVRIILPVVG